MELRQTPAGRILGSIMVPIKRTGTSATDSASHCAINKMTVAESSPEKAGVGGSIPSLATIVVNELAGIIETP
jgi:hypothetical protein